MKRLICAIAVAVAMSAPGAASAATFEPAPTVATYSIATGPLPQLDPHVGGSIVSYTEQSPSTGMSVVKTYDLATRATTTIPAGLFDFISDTDGRTVTFTRIAMSGYSSVWAYDVATGAARELDPAPTSDHLESSVGESTVSWRVIVPGAGSDVAVHDLVTGVTQVVTTDGARVINKNVAVAPDGSAVTFTKCSLAGVDCDIWAATKAGGWTPYRLTGVAGEEINSDTDGTAVVFDSVDASGYSDVWWVSLAGGTPTGLALPGNQVNPSISNGVIAFENQSASGSYDLALHDLRTGRTFDAVTSATNEYLNDVSVRPDGVVDLVWTSGVGLYDQDVFGASYRLPGLVRTPAEQLADLRALVVSFNVKQGIANSLDAKLANVQKALDAANAGDTATACSVLTAFASEVSAQSGKALTTDQAKQLLDAAAAIRSALGCN